jgi:PPOX class probable F420-dependent enzyme
VPSRRDQIRMTDEELGRFIDEQRILVVATDGRDSRPHLTALWYVVRDGEPWIFTYGSSQKIRNLERSPRATLMIESGVEYGELRGATIYADATIHRDAELIGDVAEQLFLRYNASGTDGSPGLDDDTRAAVRERVGKRVAVQFRPTRIVSWDHAKLGGTY